MYTKLFEGQIIFYFAHKDLFEDVQHQSAYMCKNISTKDGEDLSERYAITDDEQPMFALCLRETLPSVYDKMKVITHGIDGAFTESMTGTAFKALFTDATTQQINALGVTDSENYVVIRVNDNEAYNPNDLAQTDSALRSSIESGSLAEFYTRVMHADLTQVSSSVFAGQLVTLSRWVIPLRKKSVF